MGVDRPDMCVTADPVFTFDGIPKDRARQLLEEEGIPTEKPFVGVSLRSWYSIPDFKEKMARICDEIYSRYDRNIVFIAMQTPYDTEISRQVQQRMQYPSYIPVKSLRDGQDYGHGGMRGFRSLHAPSHTDLCRAHARANSGPGL